jgi:uncharacterized protein YecE (DUF72 family)
MELHFMGRSILPLPSGILTLPSGTENFKWLNYYSHVFDYVEIDSSFYRTPALQMVKNWAMKTPKNFKFTAKFPKAITHDKRLLNVEKELERFFDAIGPLENKTLALDHLPFKYSQDWNV